MLTVYFRVMHPADMLVGILAFAGAYLGCNYVLKNQAIITDFKKNHPVVTLVGVCGLGYMVTSLISSVLVFSFGILLPIVGKYYRILASLIKKL